MREDEIWPNNQMKLRQITKRVSANCHIKNRPTATFIVKKVAEFEI